MIRKVRNKFQQSNCGLKEGADNHIVYVAENTFVSDCTMGPWISWAQGK